MEQLLLSRRTEELAQMLGAASEATHLSAVEMCEEVEEWKAAQSR